MSIINYNLFEFNVTNNNGLGLVEVRLDLPDLRLTMAVTPTVAAPGDWLTYTLIFSNVGTAVATDVSLINNLPAALINTSFTSSLPVTVTSGTRYVWQLGDLMPAATGMIRVVGQLAEGGGLVVNTAVITTAYEHFPADNGDTAVVLPTPSLKNRLYLPLIKQGNATLSLSNSDTRPQSLSLAHFPVRGCIGEWHGCD